MYIILNLYCFGAQRCTPFNSQRKVHQKKWRQMHLQTLGICCLTAAFCCFVLIVPNNPNPACLVWLQRNKPRSGTMNLGRFLTWQIKQIISPSVKLPRILIYCTWRTRWPWTRSTWSWFPTWAFFKDQCLILKLKWLLQLEGPLQKFHCIYCKKQGK